MTEAASYHYERIAQAIGYISRHFREQPDLDTIAAQVHMSPFHFQRMFREWAGVSPKKFLQYLSLSYAKSIIREPEHSLSAVAWETGLSGTGRLHDLFVQIEGMTPGAYKDGGAGLTIHYSFATTPFGDMLIASTTKGICHMAFAAEKQQAMDVLLHKFPRASYTQITDSYQQEALRIFGYDWSRLPEIKLHLKGTAFQLKVWESLLSIPKGSAISYASLAARAGYPGASRAAGTAIGKNPVAFIIPCHRVLQASGHAGGYHWGPDRKLAMIGWEAAWLEQQKNNEDADHC